MNESEERKNGSSDRFDGQESFSYSHERENDPAYIRELLARLQKSVTEYPERPEPKPSKSVGELLAETHTASFADEDIVEEETADPFEEELSLFSGRRHVPMDSSLMNAGESWSGFAEAAAEEKNAAEEFAPEESAAEEAASEEKIPEEAFSEEVFSEEAGLPEGRQASEKSPLAEEMPIFEESAVVTVSEPLAVTEPLATAEPLEETPSPEWQEAAFEEAKAPALTEPSSEEQEAAPFTPASELPEEEFVQEVISFDLSEKVTEEKQEPAEVAPSGAAASGDAVFEEVVLEETVSEEMTTEETIPEEVTLEAVAPETVVPEAVASEDAVTEEVALEETIPEEMILEDTVAEEPIPEESVAEPLVEAPAFVKRYRFTLLKRAKKEQGTQQMREEPAASAGEQDPAPLPAVEEAFVGDLAATPPPFSEEEPFAFTSSLGEEIGILRPQDFFIADIREQDSSPSEDGEYVSRNQIESILLAYHEEKKGLSLRFFLSLALSVVLLVFENLNLFGVSLETTLGLSPSMPIFMDLAFLLVSLLLSWDMIPKGLKEWYSWTLGVPAALVTVHFLSAVVLLLNLFSSSGASSVFAVLPVAVATTLALFFRWRECVDREHTFLSLCESGDKLAAESIPGVYAQEESEAFGKRLKEVVRIKKVGFVDGFFSRIHRSTEEYALNRILTLILLFSSVLSMIVYILVNVPLLQGEPTGIAAAFALLTLPLFLSGFFGGRYLPYGVLVKAAERFGCAVLGEASAEEYGEGEALCLEDVEAFPARKVTVSSIIQYYLSNGEICSLPTLLYYAAGAFSVLGGPLDGIFRVSCAEVGLSEDVEVLSAEKNACTVMIDGHTVSFARRHAFAPDVIEPYTDPKNPFEAELNGLRVMYMSLDGEICAKFYLTYTISRRFEQHARRLSSLGMATMIRSFDPNIDDDLIASTVHSRDLRVACVKKKKEQLYDFAQSRVESGLVGNSGSKDLLHTLFLCRRYCMAKRLLRGFKLGASVLSLALALFWCFSGRPFYSVYVAALQLLWLLPPLLLSRCLIDRNKNDER